MDTIEQISDARVIAVMRGFSPERIEEIAGELLEGGVRIIEVTMDSPGAEEAIERLSTLSDDLLAGAGTVRTTQDVTVAKRAGARFALSPVLDPEVVEACQGADLAVVPGCLTPTEMMEACQLGADGIKLFPATNVGPSYLRRVRAPLPEMPYIPTGGIDPGNAGDFLEAGASAVGVGSFLTGGLEEGGMSSVRRRAQELTDAVSSSV